MLWFRHSLERFSYKNVVKIFSYYLVFISRCTCIDKLQALEGRKSNPPGDLQNVESPVLSFSKFGRKLLETYSKLYDKLLHLWYCLMHILYTITGLINFLNFSLKVYTCFSIWFSLNIHYQVFHVFRKGTSFLKAYTFYKNHV